MGDVERLKELIDSSDNIVFFGGAGVSTESGIPDFRSKDGLYNQHDVRFDMYQPEYLLSHSCLVFEPKVYYEFHRQKMDTRNIEPNDAHKYLAKLEEMGKLKGVVTQNIDGLHQKAGSKVVYELHGSTLRNYCMDCGEFYDENFIAASDKSPDGLPRCTKCGGLVKPDVVLYEEGLDDNVIRGAVNAIAAADTLIIGGTSLVVYPAASFVDYFHGKNLVLLNKSTTSKDDYATLVIHEPIGQVLSQIKV